jgi:competence protein ComEC
LLAIIIDRTPISMRLAACAATAVIVLAPESLLGASFQMSFAAVIALIAFYEVYAPRLAEWRSSGGWMRLAGIYLAGVILTTLVASLATAPFSIYHFSRMPLYGSLIANLVAIPLTAVVVMPAGLAGLVLMPFGWEEVALVPMGWGLLAMVDVAREISTWPGTVALVPAMPPGGLFAVVLGGLWLCLWRRRWRLLGLVPIAAGCMAMLTVRPPDVVIGDTGGTFAARTPSGDYVLRSSEKPSFRTESWLRTVAREHFGSWPAGEAGGGDWLACDALGCVYRAGGQTVAFVTDPRSLAEDCAVAGVIVSVDPVSRSRCRGPAVVIDRFALWRGGAHALWLSPGAIDVQTVAERQGDRPWSQRRGRRTGSGRRDAQ